MQLYEYAFTRSIRARWTLQELGVDFEAISVNLFAGEALRPEFLKLNPAAKLPVLADGDFVLTESAAIVLYLAEKYGKFLPTNARGRAEVNKWLLFTVTELEQPLWRIAKNEFLYPEEQRLAADIPLAGEDFRRMADVAEKHMQGRAFAVGDSATVADFVLAYTLDWANEVQLLDRYRQLTAYMERMYARPKAPKRIAELRASMQDESARLHVRRTR